MDLDEAFEVVSGVVLDKVDCIALIEIALANLKYEED